MDDKQDEAAKQQQMEEMRHSFLAQILTNEARERRKIAIVKPEKARVVEEMLIRMRQTGQIRQKVDEDQLKGLLEQISGTTEQAKPKVTIQRRRMDYSDDEDEDYGL
ncbi:DNA-binding TFAR19-related protein domain-containing protein [Rozella allomycis CSF55]|uniref:DNA-binding TFAR19-related protein domain-containing protein n=1 Tax=Rozella allomycis (strain CSF55) TaxID=988480 RepID=A0A075APJ2_ROZAC|nr:DNA-binding TFAR19-related protein domain-containing protein [Rozella allomycis CSF55]|eukprot:EPZ32026.1 DNA-binding TFAR19-related protein domain-containing protein [Rozella allomycis CSF55]